MHKEAQQEAGGPTSLGATCKEGTHPQLSSGADSIAEADPGPSTPNDSIPLQQDTRSVFFTPDSPLDEPINVSDESDQKEVKKAEETLATSQDVLEDTSVPHPPSPRSTQFQELMA
uniref:Uncharacterized protein n=1 Tax=Tanacetum cinerariifolium TaxID=118510 RepID=A0A699KL13_TANCI|nr:hypothetical protein [Tanacetum cinerariifolium]